MARKLLKYRTITGTIHNTTGLRIGGTSENIDIGGMENPVIRHPVTNEPYIPGSSLKGKVRSLLENKYGRYYLPDPKNKPKQRKPKGEGKQDDGEPCQCGLCDICKVFGPHKNMIHEQGPTRVLFRDAGLNEAGKEWLLSAQSATGLPFSEVKTENMVMRTTGAAEHPRQQERVPAGAQFDFEISVRIFDDDEEEDIIALVKEGLDLLTQDYLGASGSRGYGKIEITYDAE